MAAKRALLIGGAGQIGRAAAATLLDAGWEVVAASRSGTAVPGTAPLALDREDTAAVLAASRGADLVLDTVAYGPQHAEQLAGLAGEVGSLVVISTASVYTDAKGRYLDTVTGPDDFPHYPDPVSEDQPTVDDGGTTYSPQKAELERRLLATPDLPVSILRPGAIHGPHSRVLREWYFAKRVLDGRTAVALAYDGASRFGTSAVANIAELVRCCAERPGRRALNAVDDASPTVAEIARAVAGALDRELEVVGVPGAREDGVGSTPWSVPRPFVLSMHRAAAEVGYRPAVDYADGAAAAVRWFVDEVRAAGGEWATRFPFMVERYGAAGWFDYDAEDAVLAGAR
jgi:nucleoside-diphosphate-sugar epimerase